MAIKLPDDPADEVVQVERSHRAIRASQVDVGQVEGDK